MKTVKVIEITGNSTVSFEDAIKKVVRKASKKVKIVKSFHGTKLQTFVDKNRVTDYRVSTKLAYVIEND